MNNFNMTVSMTVNTTQGEDLVYELMYRISNQGKVAVCCSGQDVVPARVCDGL